MEDNRKWHFHRWRKAAKFRATRAREVRAACYLRVILWSNPRQRLRTPCAEPLPLQPTLIVDC
eukprot:scaffold2191_cov392-Prasinococcus_capsulatus_cf.AAC.3